MDDEKLIRIDELARKVAEDSPGVHIEILPNYDDMLFLYRIGAAEWSMWAGSLIFRRIIDQHGTEQEKQRLARMDHE